MSTFLMVNPSHRGLVLWRDGWLALNTNHVANHSHKDNTTTMRNGDVYLWRRLDDSCWWCIDADAVFFDDRCAELPLTAEQEQLLGRLAQRVR